MNISILFGFLGILSGLLIIVRSQLVFNYRRRARALVSADLDLSFKVFDESFDAMVWDFRKWTFNQFYPYLKESNDK